MFIEDWVESRAELYSAGTRNPKLRTGNKEKDKRKKIKGRNYKSGTRNREPGTGNREPRTEN
jgi:hypothetical protein